jgi:hypothetical protein
MSRLWSTAMGHFTILQAHVIISEEPAVSICRGSSKILVPMYQVHAVSHHKLNTHCHVNNSVHALLILHNVLHEHSHTKKLKRVVYIQWTYHTGYCMTFASWYHVIKYVPVCWLWASCEWTSPYCCSRYVTETERRWHQCVSSTTELIHSFIHLLTFHKILTMLSNQ